MLSSAPPCSPTSSGMRSSHCPGLGLDPAPGTDRYRAAHRQDLPRLWRPVGLGAHPGNAGDDRRHSPPGLRRALRAGPGCQHQSAGGGVPRHRIRAPSRQAARRRDQVRTLRAGQPSSATPRPRGRCAWASRSPRGTHLGRRAGPSHDPVAAELDDGWISALVARDRLAGAAVRSASSPKPPHHTRDPSRSRPGPSLPSTKTPTRPGPSPQAIPPGT
jgi:hypothetical protein